MWRRAAPNVAGGPAPNNDLAVLDATSKTNILSPDPGRNWLKTPPDLRGKIAVRTLPGTPTGEGGKTKNNNSLKHR